MAGYRIGRINEQMAKELAEILRTVKDPRVSGSFITITSVDCTPDLKYAKIYYSAIGSSVKKQSETEDDDIARGLKSALGYIRGQLASRLNLRITPEIKFIFDSSVEHGAKINDLLKQVEKELGEGKNEDDTESDD